MLSKIITFIKFRLSLRLFFKRITNFEMRKSGHEALQMKNRESQGLEFSGFRKKKKKTGPHI